MALDFAGVPNRFEAEREDNQTFVGAGPREIVSGDLIADSLLLNEGLGIGEGNITFGTGGGSTRMVKLGPGGDGSHLLLVGGDDADGNASYIILPGKTDTIFAGMMTIHPANAIKIILSKIPGADPSEAGQLWRDGTDLKISEG